ncbi:MAG TPA: carboxypeptidase-like regulatory domain-containing protein [Longimicrobiaceae bacterium]|nr:carboxypeptidase-like regulatory domain-containing protein [Longimicrobiaceae bacterium]
MLRKSRLGLVLLLPLTLLSGCLGLLDGSYRYGTIGVKVSDPTGAGVAGVRVLLYDYRAVQDEAVTDGSGHAEFVLVPRGNFGVRAAVPEGYVLPPGARDYKDGIDVDEGTHSEVLLVLAPLPAAAQP